MSVIFVDNQEISFKSGESVLQALLRAKIDIPYFCYHEALGPAGSCRVCALETEPQDKTQAPRIIMSCMQPAQHGQRYVLSKGKSPQVRKNFVEFYMTRHPHDCPVCDEAGECHLQEMTVLSKHTYRRYNGKKKTFKDQNMGSLIWNNANRCITCYRCVRFYQNYALGDDLGVYGSGQKTTFRRADDGAFNSPFSGNLIDVCPTGTFTDKVFRRKYSRTWQLEKSKSICCHCSVGCNVEPGGRDGSLRRVHPAPNKDVNSFFICDRGRFGEHYSDAKNRPIHPKLNGLIDSQENVLDYIEDRLEASRGRVAVLGSTNEDLTSLCALKILANHFEGTFSAFATKAEEIETRSALNTVVHPPKLADIEQADGVLVLGSLTESAPMMDLAVRQVLSADKPVYTIHASSSGLASLIKNKNKNNAIQAPPGKWSQIIKSLVTPELHEDFGHRFFSDLQPGKKIVILGVANEIDEETLIQLSKLSHSLIKRQFLVQSAFGFEGANAIGSAAIGPILGIQSILKGIEANVIDTLVVCGTDILNLATTEWNGLLKKITHFFVMDNVATKSVQRAEAFIPLNTWPEKNGITINYEGRVQQFSKAYNRENVLSVIDVTARLTNKMFDELNQRIESMSNEIIDKYAAKDRENFNDKMIDITKLQSDSYFEKIDKKADINENDSRLQVVLIKWHGEGYRANFAEGLSENNPWSENCFYINSKTAKKVGAKNKDSITIKKSQNLEIICDDNIAEGCVGLTSAAMSSLQICAHQFLFKNDLLIGEG